MNRLVFFALTAVCLLAGCENPQKPEAYVMTVRGKIPVRDLGQILEHEHITTDFIGAEKVPQPQYREEDAIRIILPRLKELKARGIGTLVECTPNYLGRDVKLLKKLSELADIHIVTNTGYYAAVDKKYLPAHFYQESADMLVSRWEKEWTDGIEGTGIRPGFIKLGVGSGPLDSVEEKLVRAGARLALKTGLALAIHTGDDAAAQSEFEIVRSEGLPADRMIWVHAQNGTDEVRAALAQQGVWISLDNVNETRIAEYLQMLTFLKTKGLLSHVLISHDDGWGVENQGGTVSLALFGNGNTVPYSTLFERLMPEWQKAGISAQEADQLLRENPVKALGVRE